MIKPITNVPIPDTNTFIVWTAVSGSVVVSDVENSSIFAKIFVLTASALNPSILLNLARISVIQSLTLSNIDGSVWIKSLIWSFKIGKIDPTKSANKPRNTM